MKNKIGQISLLSTLGGLTVTQICIHVGWLQGYPWTILAAGFEAGTVGGLADWFAVSALFREIPIPIVRRHTNIIVKNRRQLTERRCRPCHEQMVISRCYPRKTFRRADCRSAYQDAAGTSKPISCYRLSP